jgi:hypothetical protein
MNQPVFHVFRGVVFLALVALTLQPGMVHAQLAPFVVQAIVVVFWALVSSLAVAQTFSTLRGRWLQCTFLAVDAYLLGFLLVSVGMGDVSQLICLFIYLTAVGALGGVLSGSLAWLGAVLALVQGGLTQPDAGHRWLFLMGGMGGLAAFNGVAWGFLLKVIGAGVRTGGFGGGLGRNVHAGGKGATESGDLAQLRKRLGDVSEQLEKVGQERDKAVETVAELQAKLASHASGTQAVSSKPG